MPRPRSLNLPLDQSQSRLNLHPQDEDPFSSFFRTSGSPPTPVRSNGPVDLGACCEGCRGDFRTGDHRVQCTVCYDYDLCAGCFYDGKVSKGHNSSHKVSHVLSTLLLKPDDLVPAREGVNPRIDLAKGGRENWSLVRRRLNTPDNGGNLTTLRRLHLFNDDSHARFLTYAPPGHYGLSIKIGVHFDPGLFTNAAARQQLLRQPGGAGMLRITMGVVADTEKFAGTIFPEDSFSDETVTPNCLPNKLFQPGHSGVMGPLNIEADKHNTKCVVRPDMLLHVKDSGDSRVGIGLLVQWSGVALWEQATKPLVSITVLNVS